MREREAAQQRRQAGEFEAFVAGAAGRLLHAATLLSAEPPDANPRAQRLLAAALARTYVHWESLRGEDPYDRTRQELAARFARTAWHHRPHLPHLHRALRLPHRPQRQQRPGLGGVLESLTPQERLIVVLRLYEGVPEEQAAAQIGLPVQRVRAICARAVSQVYESAREPRTPQGPREPRPPQGRAAASP
ncbi:sigma factor-like helix-turn-helix DNA-binding protein [Streptomyces sp. NPDC021093]|uniref:sigma factor-like helix-turn-helix DNA-binding protein n=1 Tax=Streptomyces sp. NPDC021093 TaxID=3365112 RepID=UPI00378DC4CB